jgi:uncharacterized protein with HEPN domain
MRPDEADAAYLLDMYEACQEALIFIEGVSVQQFLSDPLVRRGVERDLEIAGEAARRVSGAFQGAHPEVPWREIIGQRNVLAHDYGGVVPGRLWETLKQDLPELVATLRRLLPSTTDR